jgi:hypothetical protein
MKQLATFLMVCLLVAGIAKAQDPGLQDSLIVSVINDHVDSSSQFQFRSCQIFAVTDDSVMFYNLPLRWNAPAGGVACGTGTQYFQPLLQWNEKYDTVMMSQNYVRQIGWADLGIDTLPHPPLLTNMQRVNAWTLRFSISPNTRSQLVTLDTCWDDRNGSVCFGLIGGLVQVNPAFQRGFMSIGVVGVDENEVSIPVEYALEQNYPNPFNPETNIEFSLPKEQDVSVSVFNLLGQQVRTLVNSRMAAGNHTVRWDGKNDNGANVPSGIYFYKMYTPEFSKTNKMVMVR